MRSSPESLPRQTARQGVERCPLIADDESDTGSDRAPAEPTAMELEPPPAEKTRAEAGVRQYATGVVVLLVAFVVLSYATMPAASHRSPPPAEPFSETLARAGKRALGGGLSGAFAAIFQVLLLMWLRTTMNYQYRYGTSLRATLHILYAEGGVCRFYQGLPWALLQTPLTRFGDTASNTGILLVLAHTSVGAALPMSVQQVVVSAVAAGWRMLLTPVDTVKTTMQVQGASGYAQLRARVRDGGAGALYTGAIGNAVANFVGNYPWYLTFNTLSASWVLPKGAALGAKLLRNACLGFAAACVSDCCSNSIRVLKTTRQTSEHPVSYAEAARMVLEKDGWQGLLGRGLGTRLMTNGIQASLFTVVWKLGEDFLATKGLN